MAERRYEADGHVGVVGPNGLGYLQAAHVRHLDIKQVQVAGGGKPGRKQRVPVVVGHQLHPFTALLEEAPHQTADLLFVARRILCQNNAHRGVLPCVSLSAYGTA